MIIDASVWISSFLPGDEHHQEATLFLSSLIESGNRAALPATALAEIAAVVARESGPAHPATALVEFIANQPWLEFAPVDETLGKSATDIAVRYALPARTAVYVALAMARKQPLITLDPDTIERAPESVACMTPGDWMRKH